MSASQSFTYIKGVPKKINQVYAGKYGHQLKDFYARIQNAAKTVKRDTEIEIKRKEIHEIAYTSIVGLDKYVHEANHKGKPLTLDNMCQLIYKIAKNQFYQLIDTENEDYSPIYPTDEEVIHKKESSTKLFTPKRIIRKEMVPNWLKNKEHQKKGTQEQKLSVGKQLQIVKLKQDLGQKLTEEDINLLEEHNVLYTPLKVAQLKKDLGQALTPEEQELLHQHAKLKEPAS